MNIKKEYEIYRRDVTPEIAFFEWCECVAGIDITSKKELLRIVEENEVYELDCMSDEEANRYMSDWLQLDSDEYDDFIQVPRIDRINRYMDNFMEWKRSYGVKELQELLALTT